MEHQKYFVLTQLSSDPAENLALEDYLLHEKEANFFFVYENRPSVIIGKHQNVFQEVQLRYCKENSVEVYRRLSGGGTVFHGPGNLNFTFIENLKSGKPMIDFRKYLSPIIDALKPMGIEAKWSGRNDLLLDGFKISGNAQHVFQKGKRVIHHGTLLVHADLGKLKPSIAPKNHIEFTSHAVQSVRSKVTNILSKTNVSSMNEFSANVLNYVKNVKNASIYELTPDDLEQIQTRTKDKYRLDSWNIGYTPKFSCILKHGVFHDRELHVKVQKGAIIEEVFIRNGAENMQIMELKEKPFSSKSFEHHFPFKRLDLPKPTAEEIEELF